MICHVRIVLIALLAALILAGCQGKSPAEMTETVTGDKGRDMDIFLRRLAAFDFNGSVLVAQKGEILLQKAYGMAQVDKDIANHIATAFSTGSVTKQFTAAAIMKLEMAGRLAVTDSITRFFDNVPKDKRAITVHHLLTHSSGFQDNYGPDKESITRDKLMKKMLKSELAYPVGDHYEYSNAGYSMLAAIVEKVSGMDYEAYLQQRLFKPNGIHHAGLSTLKIADTLIGCSHNKQMSFMSPAERPKDHWNLRGNGGILATTGDMYRWMQALQGTEMLSAAAKEKMFSPQIREYEDGDSFYGYGWVVQPTRRGGNVIWHNGGAMPHGWSCAVYHYVNDSADFIVFSNKPIDGRQPVDDIVGVLSRILFADLPYKLPPAVSRTDAESVDYPIGKYTVPSGERLEVMFSGNALVLSPEGQQLADFLFPSPMADRLPKYNGKTRQLVRALSKNDFEAAAEHFDKQGPDDNPADFLKEWWQSFDSLGAFKDVKIRGTKMGGGAETYCRINFAKGGADCCFVWMGGKCRAIIPDRKLQAKLLPTCMARYAGYSLAGGLTLTAEFKPDSSVVLALEGDSLTARPQ